MTTHAMEEADALSDRIGVMAKGAMRYVGTPLQLKNQFGEGYRLSVVTEKKWIQIVQSGLEEIIPGGKVLDSSGGSLIFSVPYKDVSYLQKFAK